MTESKRERFVRIAEKRTQRILDRLRILSNLANRNVYEYSSGQIAAIFRAIEEEAQVARRRFERRKRAKPFTLANGDAPRELENARSPQVLDSRTRSSK